MIPKIMVFLRSALSEGAVSVELDHLNVANRAVVVGKRWSLREAATLEDLADEIESAASQHADALGGVQRFIICSYDRDRLGSKLGQIAFRAAGSLEDDREVEDSEPANLAGVTKQLMRHSEIIMRQSSIERADTLAVLKAENLRLTEENARYSSKHLQLLEMMERMTSLQVEREIAAKRELASEARKERVMGSFERAFPLLLARIRQGLHGPKDGQLARTFATFLESVSGEQLSALEGVLSPTQVLQLVGLMRQSVEFRDDLVEGEGEGETPPPNGAATPH